MPAPRRHALGWEEQPGSSYSRTVGPPPTPRSRYSPGDRALTAPRREPQRSLCQMQQPRFLKSFLVSSPKSKQQPLRAHLCSGGVQGVAARRHRCTERKYCGEGGLGETRSTAMNRGTRSLQHPSPGIPPFSGWDPHLSPPTNPGKEV